MATACALALLVACADGEPTNAPPPAALETTLRDVDAACVRAALLKEMLAQGFAVVADDEAMLLLGRVTPRAAGGPLSLRVDFPPSEQRIRFDFVTLAPRDLRLSVTAGLLTYPGTGIEKVTPAQSRPDDVATFEAKMRIGASRCR